MGSWPPASSRHWGRSQLVNLVGEQALLHHEWGRNCRLKLKVESKSKDPLLILFSGGISWMFRHVRSKIVFYFATDVFCSLFCLKGLLLRILGRPVYRISCINIKPI